MGGVIPSIRDERVNVTAAERPPPRPPCRAPQAVSLVVTTDESASVVVARGGFWSPSSRGATPPVAAARGPRVTTAAAARGAPPRSPLAPLPRRFLPQLEYIFGCELFELGSALYVSLAVWFFYEVVMGCCWGVALLAMDDVWHVRILVSPLSRRRRGDGVWLFSR